jgi:hypothetical protein
MVLITVIEGSEEGSVMVSAERKRNDVSSWGVHGIAVVGYPAF